MLTKDILTPQQLLSLFEEKASINNFNTFPPGLYKPVNHIMSMKGKCIRPLLLLMSCDMFGGNIEEALNPAFAVEVFHNFTLVHDDIMDNAGLRRGVPTVHKLFGINSGILAGDVMLSYAYKFLAMVSPEYIPGLFQVFNNTTIQIFEGQQMDIDFEKRQDVSEIEYLHMIEYKTSVLLGCCLQMGAILAGASEENQQLIYEFGRKLGLSFQIKDDYLDSFGEAEKVGKRIGGDILMNKKTYLFVSAWNRANTEQKKELMALLKEKDEINKITSVKKIFESTGARQETTRKAEALYLSAIESLKKVSLDNDLKEPLFEFADKINNREF